MLKKSFVSLTVGAVVCSAVLLSVLPAHSQNQPPSPGPAIPDGPGKEVVSVQCTRCHNTSFIVNSGGFTRQKWEELFTTMVDLPKAQIALVSEYLAKNFPEQGKPPAVVIPGPVSVSFKEWIAPTLGQRPHDPEPGPDGTIWWTGQWASVLGRLDPKTGEIKEYRTKTPNSGPHGLEFDKSGNLWFTANFKAYVGKLDPKTGEVTEYPTGDPEARDPHTPIIDPKGMVWFTMQGANMVGRLNPQTGEMKLAKLPTPKSNPYGMVIDSKGGVLFCEFAANRLASIDSATMEIKEYTLPNPETRPRRIAITSDDALWYGDYTRGYLGRFDPKTGKASEWPSPGGPKSMPYGIAALKDGTIWYSESGTKPNTLVRFDPKTEKFQTWVIPAGGHVVRNLKATDDGRNIVMAESGINSISLVEISSPGRSQ